MNRAAKVMDRTILDRGDHEISSRSNHGGQISGFLLTAVAIAVIMAVFPPWYLVVRASELPCGDSFIGISPEATGGCTIDFTRLLIQWLAVAGIYSISALVLM